MDESFVKTHQPIRCIIKPKEFPCCSTNHIFRGLGNSTHTFSQQFFPIQDLHNTKHVSFIFTSAAEAKRISVDPQNEVGTLKL